MKSLYHHIRLIRPLNVFTSGLAMVLASGILGMLTETNTLILVVTVVMCFTGAANALNDVVDYKIDLVNRPMRPLSTGYVKKDTAFFISILLFFIGSVFCLELTQNAKVIGIMIAMPLMVFYSSSIKGIPLLGNVTIAFILGLSFLFCGAAFEKVVCLDTGVDKDDALEPYRDSGCWWIEDKMKNVDTGEKLGLRGILMEHGHNMDYPGPALVAKNWKDIYNYITNSSS